MNNGSTLDAIGQPRQRFFDNLSALENNQEQPTPVIVELRHRSDGDLHRLEIVANEIRVNGPNSKVTPQRVHSKLPQSIKPKNEASTSESMRQLSQHNTGGLSVPLLYREKGANGAYFYELADGLTLEIILKEKKRRGLELILQPDISCEESLDFSAQQLNPFIEEEKDSSSEDVEEEGLGKIDEGENSEVSDFINEVAVLTQVVARLLEETAALKKENKELKEQHEGLRQEMLARLSTLEARANRPSKSTTLEAKLDILLSDSSIQNGVLKQNGKVQ